MTLIVLNLIKYDNKFLINKMVLFVNYLYDIPNNPVKK